MKLVALSAHVRLYTIYYGCNYCICACVMVCVCVCVCVHACTCMHACMHTHLCMHVYVPVFTSMHTSVFHCVDGSEFVISYAITGDSPTALDASSNLTGLDFSLLKL